MPGTHPGGGFTWLVTWTRAMGRAIGVPGRTKRLSAVLSRRSIGTSGEFFTIGSNAPAIPVGCVSAESLTRIGATMMPRLSDVFASKRESKQMAAGRSIAVTWSCVMTSGLPVALST